MERANPLVLFAGLLVLFLVWGGAGWLTDAVYIAKHEGDAVHLLDILLRMSGGQTAHLDFMTPVGSMAFQPIVWFLGPETGAGRAFALSQVLVLAILLPAAFWVGISRLSTLQALGFGLVITTLAAAFVHGTPESTLSVSMHYNRWAWALAFLAIALSILPSHDLRLPVLDGAIMGIAFALLLVIKVTYVAGFAVPVAVALMARREWVALVAAVVAGAAFLGIYTLGVGIDYWLAYLQNILDVTRSELRASPSHPLSGVIGAPSYLGGSLILLTSVILLRQSREAVGGLVLLLLVPGFFYVTYQNFANDPQWLYLLPVLLFAMRPASGIRNGFGWNMRRATTFAAVIAMALSAPSFFNLAYSPFRHLAVDTEGYLPLLRDDPVNGDMLAPGDRTFDVGYETAMMGPGDPFAAFAGVSGETAEPLVLMGETFDECQLTTGFVAYFEKVAKDLEGAGFAGAQILQADVFSTIHWIYGDFPPLRKGAPWSYGTEAGLGAADYLLVAHCPLSRKWRELVVRAVTRHPEVTLTETFRNEIFLLYRISKA